MKNILFPIIILTSSVALYSSCTSSQAEEVQSQPQEIVRSVTIAKVAPSAAPLSLESSGILASKTEINLSFKTGGIIAGIYTDEGHIVKKGQLLAKLNLAEINSAVAQAQAALEKATRDYERIDNLFQDSVATLEQLQDTRTTLEVAQANLQVAKFNQKYSVIYAPQAGKILKRKAETNELVDPGNTIFEFASALSAQVIRIGVSDRNIVRVHLQDSAQIHFDAYPNTVFPAHISEVAESADERTGVFELELTVDAQGYNLKNGFIGKVKIFITPEEQYYKIPMNALVEADAQSASIFVTDAKQQRAKKIKVTPLYIGNDYFTASANTEIPLNVITSGVAYLQDGMRIRTDNGNWHPENRQISQND
ncbi:efflux RND transporter periplasmic adaptor subunit [Chondrinema litorale]|uniref:efflux RND transporter periplasmic adaptor subunit n=1 Tax=Chondrinema litorale TaxID=2994555 RepID=UPI00254335CB|nr:efflux RND transporter periplasmic adaptor subunit [Chondrinema litorale]UZR94668.1 efflux RND transporter periplasmic adaptor subunit [Chondrinema litorale]